jgi:hypothetical protein
MLGFITAAGNLATMSVLGKGRDIIARPWDMELEGPDWQPLPEGQEMFGRHAKVDNPWEQLGATWPAATPREVS